ncbi:HAD family hydrolase [Rhizobium paknamense]|uniref:HAD superfamily hydrolase (TIGR01509 family) n=1 Tax=Rhizobium paknamense TaxID=1206817 RepID=A0ABU0IHE9_9HYPH|nr:HAD family hydrolase [Rhizobium paknamense]MDQ0457087.1 HAD superfamily hydrolase (TIGR01509 family) [Rhizobium paknamense]
MHRPATQLVIFDCDGVLVDSEPISVEVLVAAFRKAGVGIDDAYVYENFLGRSMATVVETAKEQFSLSIDEGFLTGMREDLFQRFRQDLKAIEGLSSALDALEAEGIARCVASSSNPERIQLSLSVTGLLHRFEPHIFSATMVKNGKPAPDLFLHAAAQMGVEPAHCVVVEDSPAGIMAAKAAGMRALAFCGGSHAVGERHHQTIDVLSPDAKFDVMTDLLQFV